MARTPRRSSCWLRSLTGPVPRRLCPPILSSRHFHIDFLSNPSKHFVCFLFLFQCLLEKSRGLGVSEQTGIRARAAVSGHFVMFNPLGCGDQSGILHSIFHVFFDDFAAFLHQSFHGLTLLAFRLLSHSLENSINASGVLFGFLEMLLESST